MPFITAIEEGKDAEEPDPLLATAPGSLMSHLLRTTRVAIFLHPLLWTHRQTRLLRIAFDTEPPPPITDDEPFTHRKSCAACGSFGEPFSFWGDIITQQRKLEKYKFYEYTWKFHEEIDSWLCRAVADGCVSFSRVMDELLGNNPFDSPTGTYNIDIASEGEKWRQPDYLTFEFGVTSQASITPEMIVRGPYGAPLLAYTQVSRKQKQRDRMRIKWACYDRRVGLEIDAMAYDGHLDPFDAVVLLAMAQEKYKYSMIKEPAYKAYVFTPSLNRKYLCLYSASFPIEYLKAIKYPHRALPCSIPVFRHEIPIGDDESLLNALCSILDVHRLVEEGKTHIAAHPNSPEIPLSLLWKPEDDDIIYSERPKRKRTRSYFEMSLRKRQKAAEIENAGSREAEMFEPRFDGEEIVNTEARRTRMLEQSFDGTNGSSCLNML